MKKDYPEPAEQLTEEQQQEKQPEWEPTPEEENPPRGSEFKDPLERPPPLKDPLKTISEYTSMARDMFSELREENTTANALREKELAIRIAVSNSEEARALALVNARDRQSDAINRLAAAIAATVPREAPAPTEPTGKS